MTNAEMKAACETHNVSFEAARKRGLVSLPNHLTPDPFKPAFAVENRAEVWWFRSGREWKLA
jgi:hypothetical protein